MSHVKLHAGFPNDAPPDSALIVTGFGRSATRNEPDIISDPVAGHRQFVWHISDDGSDLRPNGSPPNLQAVNVTSVQCNGFGNWSVVRGSASGLRTPVGPNDYTPPVVATGLDVDLSPGETLTCTATLEWLYAPEVPCQVQAVPAGTPDPCPTPPVAADNFDGESALTGFVDAAQVATSCTLAGAGVVGVIGGAPTGPVDVVIAAGASVATEQCSDAIAQTAVDAKLDPPDLTYSQIMLPASFGGTGRPAGRCRPGPRLSARLRRWL